MMPMKHISRLLTAILAALLLFSAGADINAQERLISVNAKEVPLSDILKSISAQSDYRFVYNNKAIDVERKISVKATGKDIRTVLEKVLKGTGITFTIMERQVALSPAPERTEGKQTDATKRSRAITGKVTDSNGEALPGADVFVDGTTTVPSRT